MTKLDFAQLLGYLVLIVSPGNALEVTLTHLSTIKIPYGFSGTSPDYRFLSDPETVHKAAFDAKSKLVYAIGDQLLHVINVTDVINMTYVAHQRIRYKTLNDVEVCNGSVFVTYVNQRNFQSGGILQFSLQTDGTLSQLRDINPVGTEPDGLAATENCTLVVALKNGGYLSGSTITDPPGGVAIVQYPDGTANSPRTTILNFTAFDNKFPELAGSGVRFVYRRNNNLFSNDLKPETVTLDKTQTVAYIGLQENNAIAVVDLTNQNITAIKGLGYKDWSKYTLDPSDRDGGIHLGKWNVFGIYQPDGIQFFTWDNVDYIFSANEGDSKSYDEVNLSEEQRGTRFTDDQLAASINNSTKLALRDISQLGRLQLSNVDGKNAAGKTERLYTFGARSVSIWSASDMAQVFDSGCQLAHKTKDLRPDLFNNDVGDSGDSTVASGKDKRSDNRGSEPESVAVAAVGLDLLMFVGLENPGTIAVYTLSKGQDVKKPTFQTLYSGGIPADRSNSTWNQLFQENLLHAVDPEDLTFIPQESGLADYPLLMVVGSKSSTISMLKVQIKGASSSASVIKASLLAVMTILPHLMVLACL